jgi:hypothetical protein
MALFLGEKHLGKYIQDHFRIALCVFCVAKVMVYIADPSRWLLLL